ncbi:MAG: hypothetical protein ACI841_003352 [Planctomycetota bacterium]|jgi:hypothetical protein
MSEASKPLSRSVAAFGIGDAACTSASLERVQSSNPPSNAKPARLRRLERRPSIWAVPAWLDRAAVSSSYRRQIESIRAHSRVRLLRTSRLQ